MNKSIIYFIRFLKNEGLYRKFVKEYNSEKNYYRGILYGNKSLGEFLKYMRNNHNFSNIISNSFAWRETKQGYCFWSTVSNKWESVYYRFANYGGK